MQYFAVTHDKTKGSFPVQELSAAEFIAIYGSFAKACEEEGGADLAAHINLNEGKAYCFTKGPDKEAIRRAHEKLNFLVDYRGAARDWRRSAHAI